MNRTHLNPLFLGCVIALLSGCDAQDAIEATKQMPEKIDRTNATVSETNEHVSATVPMMRQTTQGMHRQTLNVALAEMRSEENTRYFFPPVGIMPAAKVFAEEATARELMEYAFASFRMIEETTREDAFLPQDPAMTESVNEGLDRDKLVRLIGLQAIAGFVPDEKMAEIIEEQINHPIIAQGDFVRAAKAFTALRFGFVNEILLKSGILDQGIRNENEFLRGIEKITKLEAIASIPSASEMKYELRSLRSHRYRDNPALITQFSVEPTEVSKDWRAMGRALDRLIAEEDARGTSEFYQEWKERTVQGEARWSGATPTP